jgi:hypothetical protein
LHYDRIADRQVVEERTQMGEPAHPNAVRETWLASRPG